MDPPMPRHDGWLARIGARITALRHFPADGTEPDRHQTEALVNRRSIAWRRPARAGSTC
jgi:hypothetical protein